MTTKRHKALSARQQRFVEEYLIDLNATAAYKRAGYRCTGHAAESAAERMLRNVEVETAIQTAMQDRSVRTQIKADDVLKRWAQLADADPNELIEMRRACCRCCHGRGFSYQRTRGEMQQARAAWEILAAKAVETNVPMPPFDPLGGDGFDGRRDPHPDCPECFGNGVPTPFPKDTRFLSEGARLLFAGIKVTRDGIEYKMHDQAAALLNVAKHLGMFTNRHEHSAGGDRHMIPIEIIEVVRSAQDDATDDAALRRRPGASSASPKNVK